MTCNFRALRESKLWCSLGRGEDEQVKKSRSGSATPAHASRAIVVARRATGRGRAQSRGDTHDREHLERATQCGRIAGAQAPPTCPTLGGGCAAENRIGTAPEGGSARTGLCDGAMDLASCGPADRGEVWPSIQREPGVADSGGVGLQQPATHRTRPRERRGGDPALEAQALAGVKKNARRQGRIIVFIDESGLSERPTQVRGWAPRGHTPVLQYHFNWHQLSAMAGITFYRFYFRLFPGAIKGPQVIEFLHALGRQIRRKVLVIWDGLPAHRSQLVRDYVESLKGAIQLEYLPAYAPELTPPEYTWGHLKHHELGNCCARTFGELTYRTRNRLRSMQRRPTLVTAFWQQAELPL